MADNKDFLAIDDYSTEDLRAMLTLAREQKPLAREHSLPHTHPNRVLACVFAKPSLRTRVSFEVGFRQLGHPSEHRGQFSRVIILITSHLCLCKFI